MLRASINDVVRLLPQVLRKSGFALLALQFSREFVSQGMNYVTMSVQSNGRENMALILGLVATNLLIEIIWTALGAFLLISAARSVIREEPLWSKRTWRDLNQVAIESVRAMAAVFYRLPLFIVPGVVEIFRLLFVPHVVLLEPAYERGQIDALKESRQGIRMRWPLVLVVTIVYLALTTSIDLLTQSENGAGWFWEAPLAFFISVVLTLAISLVYEVFLVAVFLRRNFDAYVQLEAS